MKRILNSFKAYLKKNRRRAVALFLVYFVAKWTLTLVFGAQLFAFVKQWVN
jgi:hypothetical protein